MEVGLPDWMFAAFAIGGWELFAFIARRFDLPAMRYVGGGIVVVCAITIVVRFFIRRWQRKKRPDSEDPEAWKNY